MATPLPRASSGDVGVAARYLLVANERSTPAFPIRIAHRATAPELTVHVAARCKHSIVSKTHKGRAFACSHLKGNSIRGQQRGDECRMRARHPVTEAQLAVAVTPECVDRAAAASTTLCMLPAAAITTSDSPSTRMGAHSSCASSSCASSSSSSNSSASFAATTPLPSCPHLAAPHAYRCPSLLIARLCRPPALTCEI
eukprot:CAMPEP_0115860228 /NCGR_PEP_ID=MMETSP0287-20121206/17017_1 /TAXON_ID=412157 /ORGANISM="Chrysochromulina rotalis, Strain UIO044" /LENGTH=197 /DNA_ID=CAMNT_0003314541 /DNA_START=406 /DNA_END=1001 /DNA_ORIENTATION=-